MGWVLCVWVLHTFIGPFDLMGVEPDDSGVITTNGTLGSCFGQLSVCTGFCIILTNREGLFGVL